MNPKNQQSEESIKKLASSPKSTPPKLTVQNIIDKFVKPSTHRKLINLSDGEKNKK